MNKLLIALFAVLPYVTVLAQARPPGAPALPAGLYVQVTDGLIVLSNKGGSTNFSAGQFGFTPSFTQPPVVVPRNPGLQFTPPPAFSSSSRAPSAATNSNTIDCEVR